MKLTSLAAVADLAASLPQADAKAAEAAAVARQNSLTKPPGSLGRLEELAVFMASWRGHCPPGNRSRASACFCRKSRHLRAGVNPYPQAVTAQMVGNFQAGGAAINQLCRANGADLSVIALELGPPHR